MLLHPIPVHFETTGENFVGVHDHAPTITSLPGARPPERRRGRLLLRETLQDAGQLPKTRLRRLLDQGGPVEPGVVARPPAVAVAGEQADDEDGRGGHGGGEVLRHGQDHEHGADEATSAAGEQLVRFVIVVVGGCAVRLVDLIRARVQLYEGGGEARAPQAEAVARVNDDAVGGDVGDGGSVWADVSEPLSLVFLQTNRQMMSGGVRLFGFRRRLFVSSWGALGR